MSHSNSQQINHAKGHAFLHSGTIYYSPNSTCPINVPDHPGPSSHYRFHKKDVIWQHFYDPQWWTLEYSFLSFVLLRPSFKGDTFGTLQDILPFVVQGMDSLFTLDGEKAAQWTWLEDWLFYISALLDQMVDTYPALKPIPPSFLGFENDLSLNILHNFKPPSQEIGSSFGWVYYHSKLLQCPVGSMY